jgi:hypothetical protein
VFLRVCYLERIDEDALRVLFRADDVARIQDWFEREPSIRDPSAPYFRVRLMVREKMLRYFEVRTPSKHRELLALAEEARGTRTNGPLPGEGDPAARSH